MKCKVIRKRMNERQKIINKAVSKLTKLNSRFEFFVAGPEKYYAENKKNMKIDKFDSFSRASMNIYSSCKTAEDLLKLELPENIIKIDDSASCGFIKVKIGEYNAIIEAKETY